MHFFESELRIEYVITFIYITQEFSTILWISFKKSSVVMLIKDNAMPLKLKTIEDLSTRT